MEQYLQALRGREDISEEVLLELVERFKVVEEEVIDVPEEPKPTEIDLLNKKIELLASENEAKDDLLQEIILQIYS